MSNPLVSIVLPVYNGEEFLAQSIESVINQTYKDWELIIVNDCSTDSSLEIAKKYAQKDDRIKIINNEVNKKLPASLNIGFSNAKGEYYTWTSDDNKYYPNALEKMVNFLESNSDFGMVYAICKVLNCPANQNDVWGEIPATISNLLEFNVCGACFLYRKNVADKIGKYDTNTFLAEDHDYWLRILLDYKIANIEEVLYEYRLHPNSLTSQYKIKARKLSMDLALKYLPIFKEKYCKDKKYISLKLHIWEIVNNKNYDAFRLLCKTENKKIIYKELKQVYLVAQDMEIIKFISCMGLIYFFKALKLRIKNKRGRQ